MWLLACMKNVLMIFFFFNDTATTEIYTLSLHDALPIWLRNSRPSSDRAANTTTTLSARRTRRASSAVSERSNPRRSRTSCARQRSATRSEEHTSELQSRQYLVCRLLLEKKNPTESYVI